VYAAQPVVIDRPVWRADLLETVDGPAGSWDRTHHHPRFRGWEPGPRQYDEGLTADPLAWLSAQLSDLSGLLAGAELPLDTVGPSDAADLAAAAPLIAATVGSLLEKVRAGALGNPPAGADLSELAGARVGWL
jgi:hypothetical protein